MILQWKMSEDERSSYASSDDESISTHTEKSNIIIHRYRAMFETEEEPKRKLQFKAVEIKNVFLV